MIELCIIKNSDINLRKRMKIHYSQPKGFVGRNICYEVLYDNVYYGNIVAGSATLHLPGRNEFLSISNNELCSVINNVFYNISKVNNMYPIRNFTTKVLIEFMNKSRNDWLHKYGDSVKGFETLVEKPRTGLLYLKAGWVKVGETKGFTCKRIAGVSSDSWTGRRVWDCKNLRPKDILCYKI